MEHFKKKSVQAKVEGKTHVNQFNLEGFFIAFQVMC